MTKKKIYNNQEFEKIELFRGGSIVSSFAGSFGQSLKETRLTAILGYLIALEPACFIKKFSFKGEPLSVSLETVHSDGRSDILIKTTKGIGVVEAKINNVDPLRQSMKYPADWKVLLTQNSIYEKSKAKNIVYLSWKAIGKVATELSKSSNQKIKFVSLDLLAYLEEHNMIKTKEPIEIYAREINDEESLKLFLKAQIYGCYFEKGSRLPEALYFAPHFGRKIANNYPGVRLGINYVAKIEDIGNVLKWKDFIDTCLSIRDKNWIKKHKDIIDSIHRAWDWNDGKVRSMLFLGKPRLVFNPPVKKENLQKGKGWLSKRFLSFDELFSAWEGEKL